MIVGKENVPLYLIIGEILKKVFILFKSVSNGYVFEIFAQLTERMSGINTSLVSFCSEEGKSPPGDSTRFMRSPHVST